MSDENSPHINPDSNIVFSCGHPDPVEILRLDKGGMTYKGKRIEDAGEAHRAFLATMNLINKR